MNLGVYSVWGGEGWILEDCPGEVVGEVLLNRGESKNMASYLEDVELEGLDAWWWEVHGCGSLGRWLKRIQENWRGRSCLSGM